MKEHPILFSVPMVRAILNIKPNVWPAEPIKPELPFKWQTRRVIKPQPKCINDDFDGTWEWKISGHYYDDLTLVEEALKPNCPYGQVGDYLWVKETTWRNGGYVATDSPNFKDEGKVPSIFMPRYTSRITLEIMNVRIERIQDVSEEAAFAEGCNMKAYPVNDGNEIYTLGHPDGTYKGAFAGLWDFINVKRGFGWNTNPWVWVISFKRMSY